jgi:hypothetical protein
MWLVAAARSSPSDRVHEPLRIIYPSVFRSVDRESQANPREQRQWMAEKIPGRSSQQQSGRGKKVDNSHRPPDHQIELTPRSMGLVLEDEASQEPRGTRPRRIGSRQKRKETSDRGGEKSRGERAQTFGDRDVWASTITGGHTWMI